jgi:hypothetical protein
MLAVVVVLVVVVFVEFSMNVGRLLTICVHYRQYALISDLGVLSFSLGQMSMELSDFRSRTNRSVHQRGVVALFVHVYEHSRYHPRQAAQLTCVSSITAYSVLFWPSHLLENSGQIGEHNDATARWVRWNRTSASGVLISALNLVPIMMYFQRFYLIAVLIMSQDQLSCSIMWIISSYTWMHIHADSVGMVAILWQNYQRWHLMIDLSHQWRSWEE